MLSVKDMVKNNQQVDFVKFDNDQLWYKTECGFLFPVPVSDTGSASFIPKDKAILFMRWIKKHLDSGHIKKHLDSGHVDIHNSNVDGDINFVRYQQGQLWYINSDGFEFPVSVKECTNVFYKQDILSKFSSWIKLHLENIEAGRLEAK